MDKTPILHRTALIAALAAAGAVAAGVVVANPHRDHMGGHHGKLLEEADTDGDGSVTRAEFEALRARHLAELDANGDGTITFEEHEAAMQARARQHFIDRHDDNGDGKVSVDEMSAMGEEHFERMDRNDDGVIGPDDRRGKRGRRDKPTGE